MYNYFDYFVIFTTLASWQIGIYVLDPASCDFEHDDCGYKVESVADDIYTWDHSRNAGLIIFLSDSLWLLLLLNQIET